MERFKDGDRVCFVGDSITAQNRYVAKLVDYYKSNFKGENIRMYNCGISGGTASLLLKYFDQDVLPYNPTHIFVMLGVNDSNILLLSNPRTNERYDELKKHYENFKDKISVLCKKAVSIGADLTVLTPPPYAEYQNSPVEELKGGYALILGYADYIKSFCKDNNYKIIDVNSFITEKLQTEILYNDDRIHPNDLGHHYIAKCILKNQGLNLGDFNDYPDYLEKWRQAVISYRRIFAADNLIKDDNLTTDERLNYMRDYLKNKDYIRPEHTEGQAKFFKEIAENYIENKLNQEKIRIEIEQLFDEAKKV